VYDAVLTKIISTIQIHIQLDTLQTKTVNVFHSSLISFSFHFNFRKENCFCRAIFSYFPDFQPTQYQKTHSYAMPFGLKDNVKGKKKLK